MAVNRTLVKSFALAAVNAAGTLEGAKAALMSINGGQFKTLTDVGGLVMTAASEGGKSFTYNFPGGTSPADITEIVFESLRLVRCAIDAQFTVEQFERYIFTATPRKARITF